MGNDMTGNGADAADDTGDEAAEVARRSRRALDPLALLPRPSLVRRVEALEAEVAECRRLNLRLAELTDVVQELLVPLAQSDPDKVQEILDRYRDELGS
jgi:hypothetical protein